MQYIKRGMKVLQGQFYNNIFNHKGDKFKAFTFTDSGFAWHTPLTYMNINLKRILMKNKT